MCIDHKQLTGNNELLAAAVLGGLDNGRLMLGRLHDIRLSTAGSCLALHSMWRRLHWHLGLQQTYGTSLQYVNPYTSSNETQQINPFSRKLGLAINFQTQSWLCERLSWLGNVPLQCLEVANWWGTGVLSILSLKLFTNILQKVTIFRVHNQGKCFKILWQCYTFSWNINHWKMKLANSGPDPDRDAVGT